MLSFKTKDEAIAARFRFAVSMPSALYYIRDRDSHVSPKQILMTTPKSSESPFSDAAVYWRTETMFKKDIPNLHATGTKVLVTTDSWFYAPDGKSYRAVYGTVRGVKDSQASLGIRTNSRSTNWYLDVGNMTIAGCQIHYVIACPVPPEFGKVPDWNTKDDGGLNEYERPSAIYNADAT